MIKSLPSTSIQSILTKSSQILTQSQSPRLDVEILLTHILGVSRSYLYAWSDKSISLEQYIQFQALLARRLKNEPIAYILGHKEFWSLDLQITKATLIPRPETELLVEQVLGRLATNEHKQVVDLGTGSGAIALAIAKERPNCTILATDFAKETLEIAQLNAQQLNLSHIKFVCSNWWQRLELIQTDIVVSNPPYIAINDIHLTQGDIQYEPSYALIAGKDGLEAIRKIIADSYIHLNKKGWLLLEHGYNQAEMVRQLFLQYHYQAVETYCDLNQIERVTVGQVR